ncbi:MAG: hypothetical protein U5L96_19225 [Owenweeksia sp.]|nr:hypothetical protein [Owenweeksia sp.]
MATTDCGKYLNTEFLGGQLRTASVVSNLPYTPGPGDWRNGFVPLSVYNGNGPVLINFEFTNGGGNNLYLDNINFSASNVA